MLNSIGIEIPGKEDFCPFRSYKPGFGLSGVAIQTFGMQAVLIASAVLTGVAILGFSPAKES